MNKSVNSNYPCQPLTQANHDIIKAPDAVPAVTAGRQVAMGIKVETKESKACADSQVVRGTMFNSTINTNG